jgi:predicted nucleotidyltransferase|tara:strand:- start:607 stop:1326 length:720 start_codon:yes stop_codon:yes gene_type:complete
MGSIRQSEDYHVVIPKFYTEKECDSICDLITQNHASLISEHGIEESSHSHSFYTGLTGLHSTYNWIPIIEDELGINLLERLMHEIDTKDTKNIFIKSWCNLWNNGEGIKHHRHASLEYETIGKNEYATIEKHKQHEEMARNHMISGNIFLSKNEHREYGTWYQNKGWVENIRGDLHLFSPLIIHSVDSNTRQEARMSQAFDIHIDGHVTDTYLEDIEIFGRGDGWDNFMHVEVNSDETR